MFGEPCSFIEARKILENDGKLIVYGEPVYFSSKCKPSDLYKYYREKIYSGSIAVKVEKINEEHAEFRREIIDILFYLLDKFKSKSYDEYITANNGGTWSYNDIKRYLHKYLK